MLIPQLIQAVGRTVSAFSCGIAAKWCNVLRSVENSQLEMLANLNPPIKVSIILYAVFDTDTGASNINVKLNFPSSISCYVPLTG